MKSSLFPISAPVRSSFAVKLISLVLFIIFLSISLVAYFTYINAKQRLISNLAVQLKHIVQTAAPLLDSESHENIFYNPEHGLSGIDDFKRLQAQLIKVRDSNAMPHHPGLSPLYTLRKSWQFEKNNMLEFVVMTDPNKSGNFYTGALYPLQEFHRAVFNGMTMATDIYLDNEGAWISAAAPIMNSTGEVVAILQADRRVDFVIAQIKNLRNSYINAGAVSMAIGLFLSILFSSRFMRPIRQLVEASENFGNQNYNIRIHNKRRDEFGVVFQSFNTMAENIQHSQSELINAHKESEAARKRTVDILESISDAFLSVDLNWNFTYINTQAEVLLQKSKEQLLGKSFWEHLPFMIPGFHEILQKALRSKSAMQMEGLYEPLDMWIEIYIYPGHDGISIYFRDISQRKQAEDRLNYLANFDSLTELPNRFALLERLDQLINNQSPQAHFALLFCDLDRFKVVNDHLGHEVGDELLKTIANILKRSIRTGDMVARLSGDEFVVLLTNISSFDDVAMVTDKIVKKVSQPIMLAGNELYVPTSVGISMYPEHGTDTKTLLRNADTAMYCAKKLGKNNYQVYSPEMDIRSTNRLRLESALHHALDRNEFQIYYQPQIDSKSGKIVGAEALIRWIRPDIGIISPAEFLPIAEETGIINDIGRWMMENACVQAKYWQEGGHKDFTIAVNLSDREFKQQNLCQIVSTVLQKTGLSPANLELELTESIVTEDMNKSISVLNELRSIGIKLAIDDFGTGYSSLSYLKQFPIHTVKIDRSFVTDISDNLSARVITESIISMSHNLDMQVIAEGVEEKDQLIVLSNQGCDIIQGYLFGKPMPAGEFARLLNNPPSFLVIKSLGNHPQLKNKA